MLGLQLVEEVHQETLHGGVGLTMAKVRTRYWIPKLKQLVKKVRQSCHGCKRFQASAYGAPPPRNLPTTRTQGTNPYQVIGVDYADPIRYRVSRREPAESLVGRAVERLIGLVKSALNKTIGNGLLRWKEFQEVLLDVEITLNNRPLSYVEDDVQMPLLTPNAMLFLNSNLLPELQPHHIETADLRKRAKHLLKCKEAIWSRWTKECLRGLRQRHRAQRGAGGDAPAVGDVVIVKTEDKSRGK